MIRLENVEIYGFRGIRQLSLTLEPNKALLLHGLNGTGKSSLHQALTFGFTGYLPPVADVANQPSATVFRHVALDRTTAAWVRVQFSDGASSHWIKREIHANGTLTVVPSSQTALELAEASLNDHCFITRRQFSSMIDAVEKESWSRLTPFLGHHELARFREGLRSFANYVRRDLGVSELERDLSKQKRLLDDVGGRRKALLDSLVFSDFTLEILNDELLKLIPSTQRVTAYNEVDWDGLEKRLPGSEKAKEIAKAIQQVTNEQLSLTMVSTNAGQFGEAIEFAARLDAEPELVHDLVHAEFLTASKSAVSDLTAEACPLCGLGPVEWDNVRVSLDQRLAALKGELTKLQASRAAVSNYRVAISDLQNRITGWRSMNPSRPEMEELHETLSALVALVGTVETRLSAKVPLGLSSEEKEALDVARKATAVAHKAVNEAVKANLESLQADQVAVPGLTEVKRFNTLKALVREQEELDRLQADYERIRRQLDHSVGAVEAIQSLFSSVNQAEADLTMTMLGNLEVDMQKIFCILTDNHQLIPRIRARTERGIRLADIEIDSFYGLGTVTARDYLSEANRNSLGLAIYFAGLLRRNPVLQLLVIDDITHSADDAHRRGLAQFIANELAPRLQLIILTHDDHWHSRLKATLQPGHWVEVKVVNWSPDGLTLRSENWSSLLQKAEQQILGQEAAGGNSLRLALEQFVDEACERYDVQVPFRRSPTSIKLNDKRVRLEQAIREAWARQGVIDPNQAAVRLLLLSQQITNLASHYGSFDSWRHQDLLDALADVKDVVALFSCKHIVNGSPCGGLLTQLRKQNGVMPTCKRCQQPIQV